MSMQRTRAHDGEISTAMHAILNEEEDEEVDIEEKARLLPSESPAFSEDEKETETQFVVKNSTKHRHGLFLTIINLVNDVISVGVVSSPYYFSQGGAWVTLATLFVYLCLNAYTLQLVHRLVAVHNYHNFNEMCYGALGMPGFIASSLAMVLLNWGSQVAQLLIVGTAGPKVLRSWIGDYACFDRRYVIISVVLLGFPVALYKSIARLGIPSLFNQIFLLSALLLIMYKTVSSSVEGGEMNRDPLSKTSFWGTLATIGGLSYFYVCQDMSVTIMHALEHSTQRRWAVVAWTVPTCLLLMCVALGLLGSLYVSGGDDLLDALPDGEAVVTVARYLVCLAILCAVPYNIYLPRVALTAVIKGFAPRWTIKDATVPGNRFRRNVVHVGLTVLLLSSAILVAELITSLGLIFELIGAISGVGIGLILPPLCHLRLSPFPVLHHQNRVPAAVLVFGCFSMVGCLTSLAVNGGS